MNKRGVFVALGNHTLISNAVFRTECDGFCYRSRNDVFNRSLIEFRKSQIVARGEANDSAESALGNGGKQRRAIFFVAKQSPVTPGEIASSSLRSFSQ